MSHASLKLTTYFGERDRADGKLLADALVDLYARRELRTSVLLRGVEGFGAKHHLQTARLLSLSEDLPVVSVAVDTRERIDAVLAEVTELTNHGLVSLERARMVTSALDEGAPAAEFGTSAKLTVYLGRQQRLGGEPAHRAVVRLLREAGVAGASVLMGVDGTADGARRRARFFGRNADVPLMLIAVGDGDRVVDAARTLSVLLPAPLMTLEGVQVCKRDGKMLEAPRPIPVKESSVPVKESSGLSLWQKLMVYAGEQARHAGRPLYPQLVRELRAAGASGATCLRGIWGYHGDHDPHGDRLFQVRRRVPVLTVVVDSPERARRWFEVVDALTDETGLVTSESVPALRARGPDLCHNRRHDGEARATGR